MKNTIHHIIASKLRWAENGQNGGRKGIGEKDEKPLKWKKEKPKSI